MTPKNESPFVTIWEAPRATIRRIVDSDPRLHVNLLFFGGGVVGMLSALRSHATFDIPPLFAAGGCILLGLLSVPFSHMGAWYMRSIGGWLGGTASRQEVAAAFAWAGVPTVVGGLALWVLQFALFGTELLSPERPTIDAASPLLLMTLRLAALLLGVWTSTASLLCFAEVNRFSVLRSLTTWIVSVLVVVLAIGLPVGVLLLLLR